MSRLGKRERHEKRLRLEALKRLAIIRKGEMHEADRLTKLLPRRELRMLSAQGRGELSVSNLHSMTHYSGAYVGRSPGTLPKAKKPMPERFATAFMAPGHEKLKTEKTVSVSMVKVGRSKSGKVIWQEVGRPDTIPV